MYAKNKKPFCKVCADVGKTDTAHYVRLTPDPKSPVVCPTLLALECRYCFNLGHTIKYCALAKKNNKLKINNMTITTNKPTNNNKFAALLEEEDISMEAHPTQINYNNKSWASIAKASVHIKTKTTPKVQIDDNYQYYRHCEDYSRSPNLGAWLSEPSVELKQPSVELKQPTVEEKYRDRLYEILYEYFKNEFHRERTGKVVDTLLECNSEKELEEFMSNRLYLEDCADEIFMALKEFDPPVKGTMFRIGNQTYIYT
jgi:hypothetical protein